MDAKVAAPDLTSHQDRPGTPARSVRQDVRNGSEAGARLRSPIFQGEIKSRQTATLMAHSLDDLSDQEGKPSVRLREGWIAAHAASANSS